MGVSGREDRRKRVERGRPREEGRRKREGKEGVGYNTKVEGYGIASGHPQGLPDPGQGSLSTRECHLPVRYLVSGSFRPLTLRLGSTFLPLPLGS